MRKNILRLGINSGAPLARDFGKPIKRRKSQESHGNPVTKHPNGAPLARDFGKPIKRKFQESHGNPATKRANGAPLARDFGKPIKRRKFQKSHDESVTKSVSPHFSTGLLSLESFVQILDDTPDDISITAAQRMMPNLLSLVNKAHKGFQNAESEIQKINDKLDNDLQDIVVQEKTTDDRLRQTQEDIAKLKKKGKVLKGERSELERQLSNDKESLRSDRNYLQEKKDKLKKEEEERVQKSVATGIVVGIGLVALGPFGALLGGTVGGVVTNKVIKKEIEKAERAVSEASNQVERTRRRIEEKKSELYNLKDQKKKLRKKQATKTKQLEELKLRKKEIKDSQVRLGKLNESIKNCTVLVSTTTSRANMMAIEANGELPDIAAMIFPLKAIAGDLSEVSHSSSRLLSGNVDVKGIGCKIQMITSKVRLAITQGDMDEWA